MLDDTYDEDVNIIGISNGGVVPATMLAYLHGEKVKIMSPGGLPPLEENSINIIVDDIGDTG